MAATTLLYGGGRSRAGGGVGGGESRGGHLGAGVAGESERGISAGESNIKRDFFYLGLSEISGGENETERKEGEEQGKRKVEKIKERKKNE